jgi:hypothetical protein
MRIRKGMWVVTSNGKVGIANAFLADGRVEFHEVNDDGETVLVYPVQLDTLVQARYREIPQPRRTLSKERFAALGYQ